MTTIFDPIQFPASSKYRRPNLVYVSGTTAGTETGIVDGVFGDATILFSDGNLRTDSTNARIQCILTQNAVFNNAILGNNQGGVRTGAVTNNTWYAMYAVKVTTFAANWVLVADTVLPIQANYATLNSNFGTNGWTYLGLIRYGYNATPATGIIPFTQSGNFTIFSGVLTSGGNSTQLPGLLLATAAGTSSLTYTYSAGTGAAQIPGNIGNVQYGVSSNIVGGANGFAVRNAANTNIFAPYYLGSGGAFPISAPATSGILANNAAGTNNVDIYLSAFYDNVLGVGSNPLL